jgi:hypothetical protein
VSVRLVGRIGQQLDTATGDTTTVTTTTAANVGQFLIVAARGALGVIVSSVTDSGSNTWTKINNSEALTSTMSVWYCVVTNTLASSSTITVTYANATSNNRLAAVWAFNGITRPTTTNATARLPAGNSSITVADVTPEQYGSLLFTAVGCNQPTTYTPSSGWTSLSITTAQLFMGAAYAISTSASLGTTWTIGTTGTLGAVSATITPDGGDFFNIF